MKRKANQKYHVPLWSDVSYEVEEITTAHGITFYKTQPETDYFYAMNS